MCFQSFHEFNRSVVRSTPHKQVHMWTSNTVDEILSQGDRLFVTALENRIIPNVELLSVDKLPTVVSWASVVCNY